MVCCARVELRLPDRARARQAQQLQAKVPSSYASYFASLDALEACRRGGQYVRGNQFYVPGKRALRTTLATELEKEWPARAR